MTEQRRETVAILGCGVLGTLIAAGLQNAKGGVTYKVVATRRSPDGLAELSNQGIPTETDNRRACEHATIVILGVRPQGMRDLLDEISPSLRPGTICITIAAGLPLSFYEALLPPGVVMIRSHPSPLMSVRRGYIAVVAGTGANDSDVERATRLLGLLCDNTLLIPEQEINLFAALFGSSAALLYRFVEGLLSVEACKTVHALSPRQVVAGMLAGASAMLDRSDKAPRALSDEICTPNGMTIEGVKFWEAHDMSRLTTEAMEAVLARVGEMMRTIK
jgi:pyrroline-5-carboxylate reductase